ncbi:MAG: twin-arginine translocase subunit TatC [Candidatus Omnitrophica bacterium]|nr:twin-arginine translocase subunit TatC [Candidatus Omnitrophota bacterium]
MSLPVVSPSGLRLSLAGHLEELRRRLGISLAALLLAVGLCLTQAERLIAWLAAPVQAWLPYFAFFTPVEPLLAYMKVSGLAGIVAAMPVILWQLWAFIRSGLTPRERSAGLLFVWWGSLQFAAGAAFAYYVLLPASLRLLLRIGEHYLRPMISIDRYLSFVTGLLFWCGLLFELPVLLVVLARIGVVSPEWLRQQRPYAMLILVILAALVTPTTDPVNLCLVAVPLALLYEASIWLTRATMRLPAPPDG